MYIQTIKKTCTDWLLLKKRDGLMVFKAAFNNISDISWHSVLLVEETGVPGEITDLSQVIDKLLKKSHTIPKMNDNINMPSTITGRVSECSY